MLLIAKYSETLILKMTLYWNGLRTVLEQHWSSMLISSGLLLPISSAKAPNHLKITQICNMHAKLS